MLYQSMMLAKVFITNRKWVVVTIFVTLPVFTAFGMQCSAFLKPSVAALKIRNAVVDKQVSAQLFVVKDLKNSQVHFEAHLNSITGQLNISSNLSFPEEGFRSSISGSKMYDQMIQHFGLQAINSIAGVWVDGDNLVSYNSSVAAGLTNESAVFATWSGQKAFEYGFTKVEYIDEAINLLTNQPTVHVLFVRP